jgi:hypothetical protein
VQKYFAGPVGQIGGLTPRVSPTEGRIAIVTNAGWDAVDAAASARMVSQGESLVSDQPARRTNGAKAYGKTVWSWHPLLVSSPRRRVGLNRAWASHQSA